MKFFTATLMLLITFPVVSGTFIDNFGDENLNGWIKSDPWNVGASWTIENGELVGISNHVDGWDTHLYLEGSELWKNYEISVKSKIAECFSNNLCGTGLLARRINARQYAQYAVLSNWAGVGPSIAVYEMDAGINNVDNEEKFNVKLNIWYDLRLVVSGNNYKCFVEDSEIINLNLGKFDHGSIGLAINGGKIHFDNFVVIGDQVPDSGEFLINSKIKLATTWSMVKYR